MRQKIFSALIASIIFVCTLPASAARIYNPTHRGYALDYCQYFENNCGMPAANAYCQARGFTNATGFQIRPNVNFQTMTIGQSAICNPSVHRCDTFTYVDCRESERTFNYPSYRGYRLDYCKQFEHGCGREAADAFCQSKGFAQASNFQIQPRMTVQTITIGSSAICNPAVHGCDSFTFIRCRQ